LFIAVVLLTATTAWAGPDVYRLVAQANELFNQGKLQDALAAYQQAAQLDPSRAEIQVDIGNTLMKNGDMPGAIQAYNKALATHDDPLRARALYNRGTAQIAAQSWDDAISSLRRSLRLNPNDEDAQHNLLYAMKKKKEQEEQNKQQKHDGSKKPDEQQNPDDNKEKSDQEKPEQKDKEQPPDKQQDQKTPEPQGQKDQKPPEPTPEPQPSQPAQQAQQDQNGATPQPTGGDQRKKANLEANEIDPDVAAAILDNAEKEEQQQLKLRLQKGKTDSNVEQDW
jgi:tetratricopeptide (TPR) repeat protein